MLFQVGRILALLSLVVSVGCGQNPSIKGGGGASGGGQPSTQSPSTENSENVPAPQEDGKQDGGKQDGGGVPQGDNGPSTLPNSAEGTGGVGGIPTVPPTNGQDGNSGSTGNDGRDGKDGREVPQGPSGPGSTDGSAGNGGNAGNGGDGGNGNDGSSGKDGSSGNKDGSSGSDGSSGNRDGSSGSDGSGSTGDGTSGGNDGSGSDGSGSDGSGDSAGNDGSNGSDKEPTPTPAPTVVVIPIPGKDGRDGIDGRDGQNGKDAFGGCNATEIPAEMMRLADRKAFEAPLKDAPKKGKVAGRKIERITLADKTVEDKMVFFTFPVELPPQAVLAAKDVIFVIQLKKLADDFYPWTEFVGLLDEQIWSGMNYSASNFLVNNNTQYPLQANATFSHIICEEIMQDVEVCNTLIENPKDQKAKRKVLSVIKKKNGHYPITVTIRLSDILKGSKYMNAADYLYRNASSGQPVALKMPMVIGDDSGAKSASATVLWDKPECVDVKEGK